MVSSHFDSAESDSIGGKIWIRGEHAENRDLSRARKRELYGKLIFASEGRRDFSLGSKWPQYASLY